MKVSGGAVLLVALLAGCAATDSRPEPTGFAAEPEAGAVPAAPVAAAPVDDPTIILRSRLLPVLDAGPGAFLQTVYAAGGDMRAVVKGGRFTGWEIVAVPADRRFAAFEVGDVITAVNGGPLGQPQELFAVFEGLRTAPRLSVALVRRGEPRTLSWDIKDE